MLLHKKGPRDHIVAAGKPSRFDFVDLFRVFIRRFHLYSIEDSDLGLPLFLFCRRS